ncbi:flavin reductase (DIM6/NTAB) family NADH-FMN oxidoreductase RutF [Dyadobacter jejuensis]|uniref:Flavin reductase (DIM6/NTAB) family NADH-FMN oxidoreductase RutF n=1 Tax=Dyadobacter jejuensis TaxID=1082580 RepID=A0A316AQW8_9BACT|nr:flavin reductase family protein [Dyadobacter jejuensis]PWJ60002.1 flavin reductase (DIM6/NTAB) family NADH-FMN oxidoreductase RutF [Dyadobacter jejuensis]
MKTIDPTEISARAFYKYMTASVAPRPIAFVSTIDDGGRVNLSPFSFFNMMGIDPPIIAFAPNRRSADGSQKHTAINARQVPEVVVNMVTAEMVQQISLASAEFARGVNEFAKAGFTELPSRVVAPPRVLESPVQLECKVLEIIEKGSMELILAEVVLAHFSEDLLDDAGQIDQKKTSWVARLGGDWFAHTDHLFEVPRPQMGIGVDALPESIRNSKILTGNDLGRLGSVLLRPDPEKVIAYGQKAEIRQKIQEATLGCLYVPDVLHAYAHQLLEAGKTEEAWLVLLQ